MKLTLRNPSCAVNAASDNEIGSWRHLAAPASETLARATIPEAALVAAAVVEDHHLPRIVEGDTDCTDSEGALAEVVVAEGHPHDSSLGVLVGRHNCLVAFLAVDFGLVGRDSSSHVVADVAGVFHCILVVEVAAAAANEVEVALQEGNGVVGEAVVQGDLHRRDPSDQIYHHWDTYGVVEPSVLAGRDMVHLKSNC